MNSNNLIAFFLSLKSIDSVNFPQEIYRFLNDKTLINYRDNDGKTPLHIVAERGNVTLCIYLLKAGALTNVYDKYDKTPYDYAMMNGWGRCACLILEKQMKKDKVNEFKPPRILKRGEAVQPKIEVIFSKTPFPESSSFNPFKKEESKEPTLKDRISSSCLPEQFKKQALEKEGSLHCNFGASASKDKEWVETLLKLPINSFSSLPVCKKESSIEDIRTYFKNTTEKLDEVAYGMDTVKEEIIDCISQMISTNNLGMPRVICLQGSAGCGKTNIIRNGVSKVLNRPFHQINMGGISDADYLIGHESTYVGSKPGMIVQSLINSKVMNPIIFMDEIDKISKTEKGDDIQSVLIHLTDPIQNSDFQDKYFSGLSIDISKVLFIFSCNDDSKISPILKDRLNIIRVKEPTVADKAVIGKKYILKELIPNIGLNEVDIDEEDVKYIINKYCKEDVGLRSLKKCIETILMKINTASYSPSKYKTLKNISFPLKITQKIIDEVIVKREDKNSEFMNSMFL
jgi:ATP-dependent Lon protease